MYRAAFDVMTGKANPHIIVREEDGAFIPDDPENIDYQAYLRWLADGNKLKASVPPAGFRPKPAR